MYDHDATSGMLSHIVSVGSPREEQGVVKDSPRHVKVHPNGKVLYCVTEHCEFFVYNVNMSTLVLRYTCSELG